MPLTDVAVGARRRIAEGPPSFRVDYAELWLVVLGFVENELGVAQLTS